MKKIFLIVFAVMALCLNMYSQIGVNTEKPLQIFHVDPKGNTDATVKSTTTDDVVVTEEGTVGVGTVNPDKTVKLDVRGEATVSGNLSVRENAIVKENLSGQKIGIGTSNPQALLHIDAKGEEVFRLSDTSESDGYVLTCDANGNAYWDALRPVASMVKGSLKNGVSITGTSSDSAQGVNVTASDGQLKLAPGKWLVLGRAVTTGNISGFYMYLILNKHETNGKLTAVNRVGCYGEKSGSYIATPQFMYLLEVPANNAKPGDSNYYTTYSLGMACASKKGVTTNQYGGGYFYALRLDRE